MLIGDVYLSERGLILRDVDGSLVEIIAEDALFLKQWIESYNWELAERSNRESRPVLPKKKAAEPGDSAASHDAS